MLNHVPFKAPFAVELTGLGVLSDALVGRVSWDSLAVREELARLLSMPTKVDSDITNDSKEL